MKLSCSDLGSSDCTHTVQGNTAEQTKKAFLKHAQDDHADLVASLTAEQMIAMEHRMDEVLAAQT